MKRGHYIILAIILVLAAGYIVLRRQGAFLSASNAIGANDARDSTEPTEPSARPANIVWQKVDRASDGFRVEMPADVKEIEVPAYTETGGTEEVNMIFANPDAETTFSVAWEDDPPVARVNHLAPGKTLEMAEVGAMSRTQTDPVNESEDHAQGFPGRDFTARNSGGGVMNSRLILAGSRLYMLVAAFPSAGARRDRDVIRFFNSFTILAASGHVQAGTAAPAKND